MIPPPTGSGTGIRRFFEGKLRPVCALASYNAGRGNVTKWIEEKRWNGNGTEKDLDSIPFRETRDYVKKVLRLYNKYHEVYRGRWEE